jgi:glutamine cyclotransferase
VPSCPGYKNRQGLAYFDGHVYEGTGMEGRSNVMKHDPADNMRTLHRVPLTPSHLFGEGISHYRATRTDENTGRRYVEDRLIQLTYTTGIGRVYSLPDMKELGEFEYDTTTGEGWGITYVPHRNEFYVSDGSEYLIVWDADTLKEKRRITVTFEAEAGSGISSRIRHVNELEFVDFAIVDRDVDDVPTSAGGKGGGGGEENDNDARYEDGGRTTCTNESLPPFSPSMTILANLWYQDVLVSINPTSGVIDRVYDMRDIYPRDRREDDGADCFNGISVTGRRRMSDEEGLEVWVTGKLWPSMYRIELSGDHLI